MKVFLGTPITAIIDKTNSEYDTNNFANLQNIIASLRTFGLNVTCALEREKWGKEVMPANICTILDFEGIIDSDAYIAFPNKSYGVSIEVGWATANSKITILLINSNIGISTPLYLGIKEICKSEIIYYKSETQFPDLESWKNILPILLNILEMPNGG
jgi:hypothetical protein